MAAKAWLPPRWVKRRAWFLHRGLYRLTRGRVGLWRPKPNGEIDEHLESYAARRPTETAIVILEPREPGQDP